MRTDSFARSLLFGAVAAAAWLPFQLLVAPFAGTQAAARLYMVGLCTLYVAGLGPRGAGHWGVTLIVAAAAAYAALHSASVGLTAAALTAVLAVARSATIVCHRAPARALGVEAVLGFASLGVARFLLGGSGLSFALSVWGYFLTQSAFFLVEDVRRSKDVARGDPFDHAWRLATSLLENR